MNRLTIGAALGGAAVYFLDPDQGQDRRRRVQSLWSQNRDAALEVGGRVSDAEESMRPVVLRVKRGLRRGDWSEDKASSWMLGVTGLVVATAVGGALVYFLDPHNGLARRQRIGSALGRQPGAIKGRSRTDGKAASAARSGAKHTVEQASEAAEHVGLREPKRD